MSSIVEQLGDKVTLPKLNWGYDQLEPYISGQINELHHKKHHQTYVNGYNAAIVSLLEAKLKNNIPKTIELQQQIRFHGGGYINHVLFFNNLSPVSAEGGKFPDENSAFTKQVKSQFGSYESLIELVNAKLAGIQGSGWAFIVKNKEAGNIIEVVTTQNQDTVTGPLQPLVAIDAWEHAYYLQYQNVKLDYFKAIWNVISWKEAERRFLQA